MFNYSSLRHLLLPVLILGVLVLTSIFSPVTALPETKCCQRTICLPGGGTRVVCDMPGIGCVCDPKATTD